MPRLVKVELPTALPTLLAGVNQSFMLLLSMVVIAALIGVGGLVQEIVRGMSTLDVGLGLEAGLAIVIMAVVLDRLTQGFGARNLRRRMTNRQRWNPAGSAEGRGCRFGKRRPTLTSPQR